MVQAFRQLLPKDFPPLLREIPDPPAKLYIQGEFPALYNKFLCVVGARKFSTYGKEACEKLITGLRGYPIVIVSGLALGIDAIAHKAALDTGLITIAIPGSGLGLDALYPHSNRALAKQIVEAGGALISEFEPDFKATDYSFPQRNRIMAGMSHATLIIEAELKSGTLITSKFATQYNRDVFTVPNSIFAKTAEGPHMLLRLGATPITSSKDLLEALGFNSEQHSLPLVDKYANCSPEELKIIELLADPIPRDELIRQSEMSVSKANAVISMMEIKDLIRESLGEIRLK